MSLRTLCITLLLLALPAQAGSRRGWLTGASVTSGGLGIAGLVVGIGLGVRASGHESAVKAYYANGSAPTSAEAPYVAQLQARAASDRGMSTLFLVGGGLLFALGVTGFVLDGVLESPVAVSLDLSPERAGFVLQGRW